jgi:hypothetical protein
MKHLPLLAAEPTDPFVRRGDCEGNEDNETQNTRNDEWTLCDVVHDRMKVEELIEPDVSDEMQKAVEKGEEPKHSAKPDKGLPSCDSSKRRDAQRNHHKTQCPDTGPVPQVFNGICAQLAGESIPRQPDRRHKTEQKDGRLEYPPTINFGDHRGKFIAVRPFLDLVHKTASHKADRSSDMVCSWSAFTGWLRKGHVCLSVVCDSSILPQPCSEFCAELHNNVMLISL